MQKKLEALKKSLSEKFPAAILHSQIALNELTLEIHPKSLLTIAQSLKDDFAFEQLMDICAVDYLTYGQKNWETQGTENKGFSRGVMDFDDLLQKTPLDKPRRFAVVYHLLSLSKNLRLRLKIYPENVQFPQVDSVIGVWDCANWFEREAFDLMGIIFTGHPDLRRLLTDYGFVGHPLRKDFPLEGHVEMRYDPDEGRVVYVPVSITNRVNVPRVLREVTPQMH